MAWGGSGGRWVAPGGVARRWVAECSSGVLVGGVVDGPGRVAAGVAEPTSDAAGVGDADGAGVTGVAVTGAAG